MSVLLNRAGTSSLSIELPKFVRMFTKSPLIELLSSRLPWISGPTRPSLSSKLLGSAAMAAPALCVIVLKARVGRVVSNWIGAKDSSWESTSTCPPP